RRREGMAEFCSQFRDYEKLVTRTAPQTGTYMPSQPGRLLMAQNDLDKVLAQVSQDRRGFLKTLLVGSAVAAISVMTSQAMAAEDEDEEGKKKKKKKKKKEGD